MYLYKRIKPDNYALIILTSALKCTLSTSVCRHVQGANRRCGKIVPGPRSRQHDARLNGTAYQEL